MTVGIAPDLFSGYELVDGKWAAALAGGQNDTSQTVIAHAGGLQPSATQIGPNSALVYVSTVASANDSIKLPQAIKGQRVMILNGTATSVRVFGFNQTDQINGVAAGVGATNDIAGNKVAVFFCPANGFWGRDVSA